MLKKIIEDKYDLTMKFIILGDSNIGKTKILNLFLNESANQTKTIGYDIKKIGIDYKNKKINLQIWDTSGIEKYRTNKQNLYKNTNGIILMYNSCNEESFLNLKDYFDEINKYKTNNIPVILFCIKDKINNLITDNMGITISQDKCNKFIICQNFDITSFEFALIYLLENA